MKVLVKFELYRFHHSKYSNNLKVKEHRSEKTGNQQSDQDLHCFPLIRSASLGHITVLIRPVAGQESLPEIALYLSKAF